MTDEVSSPCKRTVKVTIKFNFMFTMLQRRLDHSVKRSILASTLKLNLVSVLDAFAKLRRATISFVMFVRLFAWDNSAPTGRIFMKFDL